MKKLVILVLSMWSMISIANNKDSLALDKVFFQLSVKRWVSTQTALVTVGINATLINSDLVKTRQEIMTKLQEIAKGDWQIIAFDRSQDSSGLEKLTVTAQVRMEQAALTNIYQQAKLASKPGAIYTINSIDFKPSLSEIQQVKTQLRQQLYQQVNNEITRLNQAYPNQNYSVNRLYFIGDEAMPLMKAAPKPEMATMMMANAVSPLTVSNEITLNAVVELASNRVFGNTNNANR